MRLASILLFLLLMSGTVTAQDGQTLISPLRSTETVLQNLDGTVVKTWTGAANPASMAYLLPDDSVLRPCKVVGGGAFVAGGAGGRLQIIDADDQVVWDYTLATDDYQQHHDVEPMPNGNVLAICWERKTQAEAEAMGRTGITTDMWPTWIVELEPVGATGANIVWEWRLWDHLIQDVDPGKPGYGVVADHPELMDINQVNVTSVGDWVHMNAIDYNAVRDEIVISSRNSSEIYVIDHSTTSAEAAGHSGGARDKGGDILYRWGNPQIYDRGDATDQHWNVIHGAVWIDPGLPGEGNILVFNNGDRPGELDDWSSVDEITPPYDGNGDYVLVTGQPYAPTAPTWSYSDPANFYSGPSQCGAYRLPDGNTVICEVIGGHMFEVTPAGAIAWDYTHGVRVARAERYFDDTTHAENAPAPLTALRITATPNPFNPTTRLDFSLPRATSVVAGVYDVRGALVRHLLEGDVLAGGDHAIVWDGRDDAGRALDSGLFVARIEAGGSESSRKLILLK